MCICLYISLSLYIYIYIYTLYIQAERLPSGRSSSCRRRRWPRRSRRVPAQAISLSIYIHTFILSLSIYIHMYINSSLSLLYILCVYIYIYIYISLPGQEEVGEFLLRPRCFVILLFTNIVTGVLMVQISTVVTCIYYLLNCRFRCRYRKVSSLSRHQHLKK